MTMPPYFESVRQRASKRWLQLEQDPDLAGPWNQLFKQVQIPRHVLSELLQNADDAGATEASVRIEDQVFIFEHNGQDFTEEHFQSLCRFGYSNKRSLHTIGFRGIGFKSTFSLGEKVELFTPSLSVCFFAQRFTEPVWVSSNPPTKNFTCIHVEIADQFRKKEIEKNLAEWTKSPFSLLFFKNLRRLKIGEVDVNWISQGTGPIPESEWMALAGNEEKSFLLIRSGLESFPENATAEIRKERMLGISEESDIPPCEVVIVLGVKGKLFVVLPTGVQTELPFACNAPFLQDPARLKIKDPETSPTNRWLLERAGELAASAMLKWLSMHDSHSSDRSRAYGLFPDVNRQDPSLEGSCGAIVEESFQKALGGKGILLAEDGNLYPAKKAVSIPDTILDVWPPEQAGLLFDTDARPVLCREISSADRNKLINWGFVEEITKQKILSILQQEHLPQPAHWHQLAKLWTYLAPEMTSYRAFISVNKVKIVPVQGKKVLYDSSEVVRLGERKILESQEDWNFLDRYLLAMNQKWTRYLAEQRRTYLEMYSEKNVQIEMAYDLLKKIGLEDTNDVKKLIDGVAKKYFQNEWSLSGSVQLAQIAAKLNAPVSESFHYVNRDGKLKSSEMSIYFDEHGSLEAIMPYPRRASQLLHEDYCKYFKSCSAEDWKKWIESGNSKLLTFIPLIQKKANIYGRREIVEEAKRRGHEGDLAYHYVTHNFVVEDWDFEEVYWGTWKNVALSDESIWTKLVERMLAQKDTYWSKAKGARLLHQATTGSTRAMTYDPVLPSWVLRLRELPCFKDVQGFIRKPEYLMRRTAETWPLMDFEPFVQAHLDVEANKPLFDLLGVQSRPTGPDRLLNSLRALAKAEKPPIHEVEKLYRRLDHLVDTCSTTDFQKVKEAFESEKLIYTHLNIWATTSGVFLFSGEENIQTAPVIRPSVADLTLWRKIGVAERPTADLAIKWLKSLESGAALAPDDARRVRVLLARHPLRIWEVCGHWLNLAGEWAPTDSLVFMISMQSPVAYQHLFPDVKQRTADLRVLPVELTGKPPFSALLPLASQIEERIQDNPLCSCQATFKDWLQTFGRLLARVELESEDETGRVRLLAERLSRTRWLEAPGGLEIIPYIEGKPAGTSLRTDVVWRDDSLFVQPLPKAKLARRVPEEIGKIFSWQEIKAALDYSFERSPEDVRDYLEENFSLVAENVPAPGPASAPAAVEAGLDTPEPTEPKEGAPVEPAPTGSEAGQTEPEAVAPTDEPTEEEAGEKPDLEGAVHTEAREGRAPKPAKHSIIERFAKSKGFIKDLDNMFFYEEDGSWIGKTSGLRFPWEHRASDGQILRYYWPRDHCLQREPLQIEADVWGLIEQQPDTYSLILSNPEGSPVEVTGADLLIMKAEGKITLYPATFRLVYGRP
jgi:hypothetical protein